MPAEHLVSGFIYVRRFIARFNAPLLSLLLLAGCKHEVATGEIGSGAVVKSAPIKIGVIRKKVAPVYPPIAKASGVQGQIILHAIIAGDGTVESLEAVSGPMMLRGAAIDAVKQWVYEPYTVNGQPTRVDTTVTVNFQLTPRKNR